MLHIISSLAWISIFLPFSGMDFADFNFGLALFLIKFDFNVVLRGQDMCNLDEVNVPEH
jgi:hypothetical protein